MSSSGGWSMGGQNCGFGVGRCPESRPCSRRVRRHVGRPSGNGPPAEGPSPTTSKCCPMVWRTERASTRGSSTQSNSKAPITAITIIPKGCVRAAIHRQHSGGPDGNRAALSRRQIRSRPAGRHWMKPKRLIFRCIHSRSASRQLAPTTPKTCCSTLRTGPSSATGSSSTGCDRGASYDTLSPARWQEIRQAVRDVGRLPDRAGGG